MLLKAWCPISVGSGESSFGPTDSIAESKEQRARAEATYRLNPRIGRSGEYTTAIPDNLGPKVIVVGAGHHPVETSGGDSPVMLRAEIRFLQATIEAMVDRVEQLGGGNGDLEPEIAACIAGVRGLAQRAMGME